MGVQIRQSVPMNALNLPRPAWMTEDLVLLEEQARRFLQAEFVPHLDKWHEEHMYPREVWTKAGRGGPALRHRSRRNTAAPAAPSRTRR